MNSSPTRSINIFKTERIRDLPPEPFRYIREQIRLSCIKNRKMNYLYRMTHIDNISHILEHGITHQSSINCNPNYVNIGNSSLIERRNRMDIVTVDGHTYSLKDYIPFYFYARMPMLYNIQHGYMVDKVSPDDVVYMVLDINKVVVDYKHDFFFSDGHAYNI